MKQFLVVDLNSDWKDTMSYKELKDLLVDTIRNDILSNHEEYDIVNSCFKDLEKMIKENIGLGWLKERLESYCYKTIDLLDTQRDLEDVIDYLGKTRYVGDYRSLVDLINIEVNKTC